MLPIEIHLIAIKINTYNNGQFIIAIISSVVRAQIAMQCHWNNNLLFTT